MAHYGGCGGGSGWSQQCPGGPPGQGSFGSGGSSWGSSGQGGPPPSSGYGGSGPQSNFGAPFSSSATYGAGPPGGCSGGPQQPDSFGQWSSGGDRFFGGGGYSGPPGPGPSYGCGGMQGPPGPGPISGWYPSPPAEMCDVFVEVSPECQPTFNRCDGGRFIMDMPPVIVRLSTSCTPPPPSEPGLSPFKPFEEFTVTLPNTQRVIFDPSSGMAICGSAQSQTTKRGAVLEVPARVTLNAQIKSNSPYGSLVLEDIQVTNGFQQKIGETSLNYKLTVEGQLSVNKGGGNRGANRLEVDLFFNFVCSLGKGPAPPPDMGGFGLGSTGGNCTGGCGGCGSAYPGPSGPPNSQQWSSGPPPPPSGGGYSAYPPPPQGGQGYW